MDERKDLIVCECVCNVVLGKEEVAAGLPKAWVVKFDFSWT